MNYKITLKDNSRVLMPVIKREIDMRDCCLERESLKPALNDKGHLVAYQCPVCHLKQGVGRITD